MAKGSVNKVILIGNLGKEPDIKHTANGFVIASFSLATSSGSKDKATGEWTDKTEWHNVTLLGKMAEIAEKWLHKGMKIFIEGRIETQKWQDKDSGEDRYKTVIIGERLEMLGSKGGESDTIEQDEPKNNELDDSDIPF